MAGHTRYLQCRGASLRRASCKLVAQRVRSVAPGLFEREPFRHATSDKVLRYASLDDARHVVR